MLRKDSSLHLRMEETPRVSEPNQSLFQDTIYIQVLRAGLTPQVPQSLILSLIQTALSSSWHTSRFCPSRPLPYPATGRYGVRTEQTWILSPSLRDAFRSCQPWPRHLLQSP